MCKSVGIASLNTLDDYWIRKMTASLQRLGFAVEDIADIGATIASKVVIFPSAPLPTYQVIEQFAKTRKGIRVIVCQVGVKEPPICGVTITKPVAVTEIEDDDLDGMLRDLLKSEA